MAVATLIVRHATPPQACSNGDAAMARTLLELGADRTIDAQTSHYKWTALHYACKVVVVCEMRVTGWIWFEGRSFSVLKVVID